MSEMIAVSDSFSRVTVVLLRPKSPGNVGSVARAMKNMGFTRLTLTDPIRYDDPGYFDAEARRMAWQAADLLDRTHTAPDLDQALAPFSIVAGTSSHPPAGARILAPREVASEIVTLLAREPSASAALLFGQEDIGLTREDISRCHLVGSIPSAAIYASLNLAQAALLFLYELRLAFLAGAARTSGAGRASTASLEPGGSGSLPAHGQLEAFYGRLEQALEEIDFFDGAARPHMMRELRAIFNRALVTSRELAIFEGLAHQIVWAARRRG